MSEASGEPIRLSVIMPVFNGLPHLREQLRALADERAPWSWEVLAVDNGSSDGSIPEIESFHGELLNLRVLSEPTKGKANALNRGIAEARGELLLFIDQDDQVAPGYLQAMAQALESHELVGARADMEALNPTWARYQGGQVDGLCTRRDCPDFSVGAALGVRAHVAREIGFSPDVGVADDIDFCWRAQKHGYRLGFAPEAVLRYRQRSTPGAAFRQGVAYGMAEVQMYLRYRTSGFHRPSARVILWTGKSLLLLSLRTRSKAARMRLSFWSGIVAGNIAGSIRWRVLYL